ncbi:hypothetical protein SAMN02745883_02265 [Caminicella sporogenes DSM 14501]|uniref:Uncharacterized protein n=1 Tax=Caminicella sporogenes DSM 14501 TaxID=1121266 RepID=A0A1M6T7U6_9FIRM|nr:hypothetical protein SAMN02745883_02265 [Caminicella sporogenes DSM 14501]
MKYILENKKITVVIFVILICIASFYYAYSKFNIKKPISAKLVFLTQTDLFFD